MKKYNEKIRLAAILFLSLIVIVTGALYGFKAFQNKDIIGSILGIIICIIIVGFALFVFLRGNRDIKNGFPLKDERSQKVLEKASSKAFYISLYLLLGIGFLSDNIIPFRDTSQAISISVGIMALIFMLSWIYYNKKQI